MKEKIPDLTDAQYADFREKKERTRKSGLFEKNLQRFFLVLLTRVILLAGDLLPPSEEQDKPAAIRLHTFYIEKCATTLSSKIT